MARKTKQQAATPMVLWIVHPIYQAEIYGMPDMHRSGEPCPYCAEHGEPQP